MVKRKSKPKNQRQARYTWRPVVELHWVVVRLNEEMEVSAFNGSITRDQDGKPVVHAHCVVGLLRSI